MTLANYYHHLYTQFKIQFSIFFFQDENFFSGFQCQGWSLKLEVVLIFIVIE